MKTLRTKSLISDESNSCPFITAYGPKYRQVVEFSSPSLAKQSFKDECDINVIMGRYIRTGVLPETVQRLEAQFADVSEVDFQSAMELVAGAQSMFNELPSNIRNRFQNDPAQFLAFTSDEKNRPELAEMGLLAPNASTVIPMPQSMQNNAPQRDSDVPPQAA